MFFSKVYCQYSFIEACQGSLKQIVTNWGIYIYFFKCPKLAGFGFQLPQRPAARTKHFSCLEHISWEAIGFGLEYIYLGSDWFELTNLHLWQVAHCTLHTAHCTLHTTHCTLQTANCTLHTAHCTLHLHLHLHLYTPYYKLNTVHCTPYVYTSCCTFMTSNWKHPLFKI